MARLMTDDELDLYRELRLNITAQHQRNQKRTKYADGEWLIQSLGYTLPNGREVEQTPMYWPEKAVKVVASRLDPAGYAMRDNPTLLADLEDVAALPGVSLSEEMAIKSALVHGPAFMFVSRGGPGEPEVVVSSASAMTASAILDRNMMVRAALELLPESRAHLYLPGVTLLIKHSAAGRAVVLDEHPMPGNRVMCAPYICDAQLGKPMGRSRITRTVMGLTDEAVTVFMRQAVSSDWYAYPREKILGANPEDFMDGGGWVRTPGGIDVMPDMHPDDEPTIPEKLLRAEHIVMPQMSMQPFSDQLKTLGMQFCGAASIPPQYIGLVADANPQSAAAVEALDVDLVREVRSLWPSFNLGRMMLARNILTVLHGEDIPESEFRTLRPRWNDPRHRGILEQGQFVAQQVQVGNLVAGSRTTLGLLPITEEEARAAEDEVKQAAGAGVLAALLDRAEQASVEVVSDANPGSG